MRSNLSSSKCTILDSHVTQMSGNTQLLKKKKVYNKEACVFLKDNCETMTKGLCITKESLGDPRASASQSVAHS